MFSTTTIRNSVPSRSFRPGRAAGSQEVRYRLNNDPECLARLVHEEAEILQVTSQQMGCLPGNRSLKYRPIFLYE